LTIMVQQTLLVSSWPDTEVIEVVADFRF